MPYNYCICGSFFRRKHIKRIQTNVTNVENIDDANTEEAGDANTFNNNDLPHEDASHKFMCLMYEINRDVHGYVLSIRQLKRILQQRGLGRRRNRSNIEEVYRAIRRELRGSGNMMGYRQMTRRLLQGHGVVVDKETVRELLKVLDPEGVDARIRKSMMQRDLITPVSEDIEIAQRRCCVQTPEHGCSEEFVELASIIMLEKHLEMPTNSEDAVILYSTIVEEIAQIL
ncbi:Hypothetical predicted protein [Paramuricea clavata]|uniref:Uncharacterized protein n=1 Tax=Paramuricea clavata TaxID=317549 RepID=A0A6S7IKB3_PARCT|nr:Hypothetical predicted protein [Paramuricea clavata]